MVNVVPLLQREGTRALGTLVIEGNDPLDSNAYIIHHPQKMTGLKSQGYLTNAGTQFPCR